MGNNWPGLLRNNLSDVIPAHAGIQLRDAAFAGMMVLEGYQASLIQNRRFLI